MDEGGCGGGGEQGVGEEADLASEEGEVLAVEAEALDAADERGGGWGEGQGDGEEVAEAALEAGEEGGGDVDGEGRGGGGGEAVEPQHERGGEEVVRHQVDPGAQQREQLSGSGGW